MTVWWPPSIEAPSPSPSPNPAPVIAVPSGRVATGRLRPPSSKSLTHRAFALALLSRQETVVTRPLQAEDTGLFLVALRALGHRCETVGEEIRIEPPAAAVSAAEILCGNAGTMFRFLVAIAATLPGRYRIDGVARLRERPVRPLTEALVHLGVRIDFEAGQGSAPLVVHGGTLPGGKVRLDGSASSQYLSALLLAGQRAAGAIEIEVPELASAPYVGLTLDMIERFGGLVENPDSHRWIARPGALRATAVEIEADFSAAAYPAAAAALTGGTVRIDGIARGSRQGDRRLFDLLTQMGAEVSWSDGGATVASRGSLIAVDADLGDIPDQVPTLAALAPFARGTTRIRNVAHLRIKESDRLAAMTSELRRAGAVVEELADGLVIPGVWADGETASHTAVVDPHGDHRIAMAMALVGLRRPNLRIADPACVGKSYPGFWRDLAGLVGIAA
jgi:3-phosphoshikimate 1-carboxyvinyltransferase